MTRQLVPARPSSGATRPCCCLASFVLLPRPIVFSIHPIFFTTLFPAHSLTGADDVAGPSPAELCALSALVFGDNTSASVAQQPNALYGPAPTLVCHLARALLGPDRPTSSIKYLVSSSKLQLLRYILVTCVHFLRGEAQLKCLLFSWNG